MIDSWPVLMKMKRKKVGILLSLLASCHEQISLLRRLLKAPLIIKWKDLKS